MESEIIEERPFGSRATVYPAKKLPEETFEQVLIDELQQRPFGSRIGVLSMRFIDFISPLLTE